MSTAAETKIFQLSSYHNNSLVYIINVEGHLEPTVLVVFKARFEDQGSTYVYRYPNSGNPWSILTRLHIRGKEEGK